MNHELLTMMSSALKHIVSRTYKPWLVKYLSKTRSYRCNGIRMEIAPGVFHPGFFFSTQLLLQWIKQLSLNEKKFLELGCGSGLISIAAAKKGAQVVATDINPIAIEFLRNNSCKNKVRPDIIQSDLFNDIPAQLFDIIAINPPYYKKQPVTLQDYAWFCGENGEYYDRLFEGLGKYMHTDTVIVMVLCDGCDMEMINRFAHSYKFRLDCVHSRQNLLEKNFIFKIEKQ